MGNNTYLIFDPRLVTSSFISIASCTNVTLKNVYIDCWPLPFAQGLVTNVASNSVDIQIHAGYSLNATQFTKNSYMHVFDSNTQQFKQESSPVYGISSSMSLVSGIQIGTSTATSYYNIQVGDTVS